jgi:hypothetical protein
MDASKPLGQERGVGFVIVLMIVTVGLYGFYWAYKSFAEVRRWRGRGVGGIAGVLLTLVIYGLFLLPSYIGEMFEADAIERGEDKLTAKTTRPITGWAGFYGFIPFAGLIIWAAVLQEKLNGFWKLQRAAG